MATLIVRFDIDSTIDPTLVDPADLAADILGAFQEWQQAQYQPQPAVEYLEAEWE